ncbi:MAG: ATP-dependent DNA helicase RecG [Lachnospiraceae bacterium]|nr:ATP-dependent DNA helicase RecG [Lachnospiraceae bacterium]
MDENSLISEFKGIGEKKAEALKRLGIVTVRDVLEHYPRGYEDRREITKISDLKEDEFNTFCAVVCDDAKNSRFNNKVATRCRVYDDTGKITLLWFNQPYLKNVLKKDEKFLFYGKYKRNYGRREVLSPEMQHLLEGKEAKGAIVPVYPKTEGITQKQLRGLIKTAIYNIDEIPADFLPFWLRKEYKLSEKGFAVKNIHFPSDMDGFMLARRRLVFEELFLLQVYLFKIKNEVSSKKDGYEIKNTSVSKELLEKLPFSLTEDQKKVFSEICEDMSGKKVMNRLVQGDVGSGKTAVAMLAAFTVIKNGYQVALMAPTEILAAQHYESFKAIFAPLGITTVLITGKMPAKEKKEALELISGGEAAMVIGTHAVIQKAVDYDKLALVITDEQHRFGVRQRGSFAQKGKNPHMLVMTATPIPRTLALVLYGDMDISLINTMPPGRKKIDTFCVSESYRKRILSFIEKEIKSGRQAYIVCPLVEENEKSELKSVTEYKERIKKEYFGHLSIECIYGKMPPKEKDSVMKSFAEGLTDILVSTTVIEVGINVPNATVMLIENAERFGLAQLHQLRGRVGRGAEKSYCILVSSGETEESKKRMEVMCKTNSGFIISEKDLEIRGPGDFFGTRQHGIPEMKIANLYSDMDILKEAQKAAEKLIKKDPTLSEPGNKFLCSEIERMFKNVEIVL